MTDIVLANATVLDVVAGELVEGQDLRIGEGRILELSPTTIKADAAHRIDLRGKVVMPGLCDAHVHAIVPINSFAALTRWPPSYAAYRAIPVLEGMLTRGFTTVRDAGGADFGLARAIEEGLIRGPRLLYSGKALSQTGGHGDMRGPGENVHDDHYYVPSLGRVCDGVDAVRRAARDEIRKGAHQVKLMVGGGIASYTDPITNVQFSRDEIRAAVEEAENAGKYVMAHAYTERCITHAVSCGVRSVEHGNFLDDASARQIVERGAFLVPTLVAYETMWNEGLEVGMPPELHAKIKDVLEVGPRSLEVASRNGVKLVYGTDLIGPLHRHQSLEFKIRAEVLPAIEVIRSATCHAAELFNAVGQIGVVAEQARADLVVVDGDPLRELDLLLDQGAHLPLIMKGGQLEKNELN